MKTLKTWTTAVHYDNEAVTCTIMYPNNEIVHVPPKVVRVLPELLPVLADCDAEEGEDSRLYEAGHVFAKWGGYSFLFWDNDNDDYDDSPVFQCSRLMIEYLWEVICER